MYKGKDSRRSADPTQIEETEALVEQQRQLCEDMQAELAEAAEQNSSLEEQCCQLEEELQRVREEAELERLQDLDSFRRRAEEREERLAEQVRDLQEAVKELQLRLQPVQSRSSAEAASATSHGKASQHKETAGQLSVDKGRGGVDKIQKGSDQGQPDSSRVTPAAVNRATESAQPLGDGGTHAAYVQTASTEGLANALLAQQLPLLPKFSGGEQAQEEPFKEWIAQFELMAEICGWGERAKLIHLATRLRGEAFVLYKSCSPQQKADYDLLVAELSQRFTPIRIQSVQTSLFHDRKQKEKEMMYTYAQELKALFYKAYPQVQEGNAATESMGCSVLSSQFVAGLLPPSKSKLTGVEGDFEKLLVKARFEEAKLREFASSSAPPKKVSINPENKPGNQSQSNKSEKQKPTG